MSNRGSSKTVSNYIFQDKVIYDWDVVYLDMQGLIHWEWQVVVLSRTGWAKWIQLWMQNLATDLREHAVLVTTQSNHSMRRVTILTTFTSTLCWGETGFLHQTKLYTLAPKPGTLWTLMHSTKPCSFLTSNKQWWRWVCLMSKIATMVKYDKIVAK